MKHRKMTECTTHQEVFGHLEHELFTQQEAAEYLELTPTALQDAVSRGELSACASSERGLLFATDALRSLKKKRAKRPDTLSRHQVQIGLDAANAGDLVPAEEVEAEAATWRAETRRKITGPADTQGTDELL